MREPKKNRDTVWDISHLILYVNTFFWNFLEQIITEREIIHVLKRLPTPAHKPIVVCVRYFPLYISLCGPA